MAQRIHHLALCVADLEASLRFYCDGLGFEVLMDHEFDGDWPGLFDGPSRRLRSVFLGDPAVPEAGIVELVTFPGAALPAGPPPAPPARGVLLASVYCDVHATLERLAGLGYTDVRHASMPGPDGPVPMATLRDPDGVLVELIGA